MIISGRLVAHPGDDSRLGALLDGDALGAGDRSATDRHGVIGDSLGETIREVEVSFVKVEVLEDGGFEFLGVGDLGFFAAGATGIEFLLVGGIFALGDEGGLEDLNPVGGCPDAAREFLPPLHLDHGPSGPVLFNAAAEGSVTRREESPVGRDGEGLARGRDNLTGIF